MSSVEEKLIARFSYKKVATLFCKYLSEAMTEIDGELWTQDNFLSDVNKVGKEYILELYGYPLLGRAFHNGEAVIGKIMSDMSKKLDDISAFVELTVTYDVSSDAEIYTFLKTPYGLLVKRSLYSPGGLWEHYCSECGFKTEFPLIRLEPEAFNPKIKCPKCGNEENHELQIGYSVFNFETSRWDECDNLSELFLKNSSKSVIEIDCKDKNPDKVINLLIKAITRLYARTACLEYGDWPRVDRGMEDVVKSYICKPETVGSKIHINLWDNSDGPRLLHEQFGDVGQCVNEYGFDKKTTYEHAFKSFYGRCKGIEFVAMINIDWGSAEDETVVFYSHEGKLLKKKKAEWEAPYLAH